MVARGYKDTEIGVIPVEWEVEIFENISELQRGTSFTKKDLIEGNIPVIAGGKEPAYYHNDYNRDGEIITLSGSGANAGYVNYFTKKIFVSDGFTVKGKDEISLTKYLFYFLKSKQTYIYYLQSGGAQPHLYIKNIAPIKIPLPPLKEQEKIADVLSTADEKTDAIEEQIQKAETLKKALLQKLLSEGIGHSEFKDSELGKIPESWEVVELDNVAKLNKQKYTPIQSENINYIGLEHINQEQGTINGIGYSTDTLSQKNCFNRGEILFGKLRPYLRKFYLADIDGVCSTEILVIKAKDNILNSILFQIVKTEAFIEHSVSKVFGTKMPRTSWAILQEFRLALPPLEEQKQIAEILSTADEKLEVLRAKKEKYETLKKGLLQKLLSGEVRTV